MGKFIVATDGACKGNPGKGTWAFVVFDPLTKKMLGHKKGHSEYTTNNEMELMAVAEALEWLEKYGHTANLLIDSSYVVKGTNEWMPGWKSKNWKNSKGEPVKNQELWRRIDRCTANYTMEWVKGHSGNRFNEAADMYCNEEYINTFM